MPSPRRRCSPPTTSTASTPPPRAWPGKTVRRRHLGIDPRVAGLPAMARRPLELPQAHPPQRHARLGRRRARRSARRDAARSSIPSAAPTPSTPTRFSPTRKSCSWPGWSRSAPCPISPSCRRTASSAPYLAQVKTSLFTILAASFFKTKDMKNDFNNQLVDGLMPAIIVFLAREGYSIDDIQYVSLDHDGTLHPHGERLGRARRPDHLRRRPHAALFPGRPRQRRPEGQSRFRPPDAAPRARASPISRPLRIFSTRIISPPSATPSSTTASAWWRTTPAFPSSTSNPRNGTSFPTATTPGRSLSSRTSTSPTCTDFYKKTPHHQLAFGSGYKFAASVSSLLVAKKK